MQENEHHNLAHESFLQSLDSGKREYVRSLDIMSDVILDAREKVEDNLSITKKELHALLEEGKASQLRDKDKEKLSNALDDFLEQREMVEKYYEAYKDSPKEFFEKVFKKSPLGEVKILKTNWSVVILLGEKDVLQLGFENTAGHDFLSNGGGRINISELGGLISLAFTDAVTKEYVNPNLTKVQVRKMSNKEISDSIAHEGEHAFGMSYLKYLKEDSIAHRLVSHEEVDKLMMKGYQSLSDNEKEQILSKLSSHFLELASHLYFVGDMHLDKFVTENGANRVENTIKKSPWASSFDKQDIEAFISDFRPYYREKFFKMYDVLLEVDRNLPRRKV